jgi:hypothetical protein
MWKSHQFYHFIEELEFSHFRLEGGAARLGAGLEHCQGLDSLTLLKVRIGLRFDKIISLFLEDQSSLDW